MSGALTLSVVYIFSGLVTLSMGIYFTHIHGNGLKSILYHLFFSWCGHYLVIGTITLASFLKGKEIIPLDNLRMMAAFFVFTQFLALVRLYFYIKKR